MFAVTFRTYNPATRTESHLTLWSGIATLANARTWVRLEARRSGQPLDRYAIVGPEPIR